MFLSIRNKNVTPTQTNRFRIENTTVYPHWCSIFDTKANRNIVPTQPRAINSKRFNLL